MACHVDNLVAGNGTDLMAEVESSAGSKSEAAAKFSSSFSQPKAKRARKSVPKEKPINSNAARRSSIYRGVTRHRWTGRYEAHLWDKTCWNETKHKKGRQVYLGAYDDEKTAAHAYDLAALKYWGLETTLNFPSNTYYKELEAMQGISKEEYLVSLRRRSSGFSRGVSKYRGVARHHHNGRWEARIGRVFGNKYLYLGTYNTEEEAAAAYDMAAVEYRGLNAVTNFDLSRYAAYLRPGQNGFSVEQSDFSSKDPEKEKSCISQGNCQTHDNEICQLSHKMPQKGNASTSTALELLFQSSKFKEMLEKSTSDQSGLIQPEQSKSVDGKQESISYSDDMMDSFFESSDLLINIEEGQDITHFLESSSCDNVDIFHGAEADMEIQISGFGICSSELELDQQDYDLMQNPCMQSIDSIAFPCVISSYS